MKFAVTLTDNTTDQSLTVGSWKLQRNTVDITSQGLIGCSATGTDLTAGVFTEVDSAEADRVVVIFGGLTGEEIITKGTSNTYTLRGTPSGFTVGAEDDSISVELLTDTGPQTTGHIYVDDTDATSAEVVLELSNGVNTTSAANIIWSDYSAIPHLSAATDNGSTTADISSADWINGYLLKNMPIGASSMNN